MHDVHSVDIRKVSKKMLNDKGFSMIKNGMTKNNWNYIYFWRVM